MTTDLKKKALIQTIAVGAGFLIAGLLYYLFIRITDYSFPCVFHAVTGYRCPSCGITRMFLHILQLDFKAAFWDNPMTFVMTPLVAIDVLAITYISGLNKKLPLFIYIFSYAAVGIAVFFCIIRNIFNF